MTAPVEFAQIDWAGRRVRIEHLRLGDAHATAPLLVFLHGLFGSSQNWASVARRLSDLGRAVALDLRNHGSSPHAPTHTLADCVADLEGWAARHAGGDPMRLVGHSMGGAVALLTHFKLDPGMVKALILLDNASYGQMLPDFIRVSPRVRYAAHLKRFGLLRIPLSTRSACTSFSVAPCGTITDIRIEASLPVSSR